MDLQTYGALNVKIENLKKNSVVVPQTAEVGQILAVKVVDDNGKPIEWELLDRDPSYTFELDGTTLTINSVER